MSDDARPQTAGMRQLFTFVAFSGDNKTSGKRPDWAGRRKE
jgi:hypothetical protein